jgi:hypothetical protein
MARVKKSKTAKKRVKIKGLPTAERKLTKIQAKKIQGGYTGATTVSQGTLAVAGTSGGVWKTKDDR